MCGIVGVIKLNWGNNKTVGMGAALSTTQVNLFSQLLFVDQLRGRHSTGIFVGNPATKKIPKTSTVKRAEPAGVFLENLETQKFLDKAEKYGFVFGHNRFATTGEILHKTAHPFVVNQLTLIHNGTLLDTDELESTGDSTLDKVDSAMIAATLAASKPSQYKDVIENLNGAFVLVWYNSKNNKVYTCRNIERPLHLCIHQGAVFLASEQHMLEWILTRTLKYNSKKITTQVVPANELWEWDLNATKQGILKDFVTYSKFVSPTTTFWNKGSKSSVHILPDPKAATYSDEQLETLGLRTRDLVTFKVTSADITTNAAILGEPLAEDILKLATKQKKRVVIRAYNVTSKLCSELKINSIDKLPYLVGEVISCYSTPKEIVVAVSSLTLKLFEKDKEKVTSYLASCDWCNKKVPDKDLLNLSNKTQICLSCFEELD